MHRFVLPLTPTAADPLCFEAVNNSLAGYEIVRFVLSDGVPRRAQIVLAQLGPNVRGGDNVRPLLPVELPVSAEVLRDFEWLVYMSKQRPPQWHVGELLRIRFDKGKPPHLCALLSKPLEETPSVRAC